MSVESRIFISWSATPSGDIATALQQWLKRVFPEVASFVSSEDIDAGTLPMERIRGELLASSCGILVITKANQERQWINFEAGSLLHTLGSDKGRVIPLLVDLKPSELRGPMGLLQMVALNKTDLLDRLVPSLCTSFGIDDVANRKEMGQAFVADLTTKADAVMAAAPPARATGPDVPGMVAEILGLVRNLASTSIPPAPRGPWRPGLGTQELTRLMGFSARDVDTFLRLAKASELLADSTTPSLLEQANAASRERDLVRELSTELKGAPDDPPAGDDATPDMHPAAIDTDPA